MNANAIKPVKPYAKLSDVYVAVLAKGPDMPCLGEKVLITSVVNQGTKKRPAYRYCVMGYTKGGWYDHEELSAQEIAI